ncbi:hypothetical protein BGZ74_011892 [Mortierella antarctica]|nr:hypothetical protein BGZ74_011892 [Mortierella antarctica]
MSVSDILERYQDASKDFLVSILNAKAKEDERKAEEERYKTEQIKLQSKQLEMELAMEKRRGSPPTSTGRYPNAAPEPSNGHYSASGSSYYSGYPSYPSSDKHQHHEHIVHTPQDAPDHPQSAHAHPSGPPSSQHSHAHPEQQHHMQPSPQSRPPFLKINTSVRPPYSSQQQQQQQQQQHSARQPHSPHSTLPPLTGPSSSKGSGRHYGLPTLSTTSAQSSPVAMVDYQSHIPPPVTPKDDHVSPTSAISPTSQNLKRKSINHDAIMDAVRAKVLRNAGQNQQREQQKKAGESVDREHQASRRKTYHANNSPETPKRHTAPSSNTSSTTTVQESRQEEKRDGLVKVKMEGPLLSTLPMSSPSSPPEPLSGTSSHSARSRSSSPSSAKQRRQANAPSHSSHPSPETSEENSPTTRRGGEPQPDSGGFMDNNHKTCI